MRLEGEDGRAWVISVGCRRVSTVPDPESELWGFTVSPKRPSFKTRFTISFFITTTSLLSYTFPVSL